MVKSKTKYIFKWQYKIKLGKNFHFLRFQTELDPNLQPIRPKLNTYNVIFIFFQIKGEFVLLSSKKNSNSRVLWFHRLRPRRTGQYLPPPKHSHYQYVLLEYKPKRSSNWTSSILIFLCCCLRLQECLSVKRPMS